MKTKIDLDIKISDILQNLDFSRFDIQGKTVGHFRLTNEDLNPKYIEWLDSLDLGIGFAELFYCAPHSNIFVHSDIIDPPETCCKMNWVYCEEDVPMNWYQLIEGAELEFHDNTIGGHYYTAPPEKYEFYKSELVRKPSIVNVSDLHGLINTSNSDWWCVGIVPGPKETPMNRIHWDQLYEKVKPWIVS
jgi:hypothetical protein